MSATAISSDLLYKLNGQSPPTNDELLEIWNLFPKGCIHVERPGLTNAQPEDMHPGSIMTMRTARHLANWGSGDPMQLVCNVCHRKNCSTRKQ